MARKPRPRRLTRTVTDTEGLVDMRSIHLTLGTGAPPVVPPVTPVATTTYGSTISMDCLGNRVIGAPAQEQVSQRFKATETSTLAAMTWLCAGVQHEGYGLGTGGTIRMTLRTDNSGMPSDTVLATYDFVPGNPSPDFVTRSFASPPSLTAGQVYHLVHTNIDPDPTANYVSVDATWNWNPTTPMQPRWPDSDWAQCRKLGANAWELDTNCTPILQISYGNGVKYGNDYAQVNPDDYGVINGTTSMVRQRFIVSGGDKTVTGVTARVARTSGTGNLVMTLLNSSGAVIDSCSVTNTLPVSGSPTSGFTSAGQWLSGTFSLPRVLTNGQTYYLRLSTDSSTSLWVRPIMQMGLGYGLDPAIGFKDGYCEKTVNGSTWTEFSTYSTTGDLQFYFTTPATSFYGSALNADGIGNLIVGSSSADEATHTFVAGKSGTVVALRTWLKNMGTVRPGYGAGDGGALQFTMQTDNNGLPSGTILGTGVAYPGAADGQGINPGRFTEWTFNTQPTITAGVTYHLVWRNIHADPVNNYASLNYIWMAAALTPRQPAVSWGNVFHSLRKSTATSNAWVPAYGYTHHPMLDLRFTDGSHWGQGYINTSLAYSSDYHIVSTTTMVRERFTVTGGNRTVTGASVRIAKTSGTGPLTVRLESSTGVLIDSFNVSTSGVPTLTDGVDMIAGGVWVFGTFSAPRTLVSGTEYRLRLSTDASTNLWTRGLQQGTGYGFDPATYFSDGVLEVTSNGGSTWGYSPLSTYGDMQFYFTTA